MLRILTKEVHTQMHNSGVVTIIKWDLSSLLTFNNDSWALISYQERSYFKIPCSTKGLFTG